MTIVNLDVNTCDKCKALEDQVFLIDDAPVLPIHPRCHCSYCVPAEGDDAEVTASGLDLASVYADAGVEGYERVSAGDGRKIVFSMAEIRSEPEVLRSGVESGIMPASTEAAGDGVRFVCNLDRSIYSCVTENITTSEVIITEKQVIHIFEGHSEAEHAKVVERLQEAVENPDYILRDEDPRTAVVLKEYKAENEERYRVIMKLAANDPKHPKNSIITVFCISRKKWDKYLRNKEILYIRPGI